MSHFAGIAAAALSGLLLYLSFPPAELEYLVWGALVPLFVVLARLRPWQSLLAGIVLGAVFAGLYLRWTQVIPGFPAAAYPAVVLYLALYYGLFALLLRLTQGKRPWPLIIVAPLLWTSAEFLRVNAGFLAVPAGLLGHTQYQNSALIQIASIASAYGVSFLIVAVNAALAETLLSLPWWRNGARPYPASGRRAAVSALAAVALLLTAQLWGQHQARRFGPGDGALLKATVVQANIPQRVKLDYRRHKEILAAHLALTRKAAGDAPDLIVWPEAAVPGYLNVPTSSPRAILKMAGELGIPLLLGSASSSKVAREPDAGAHKELKNSAFLVNDEGVIISAYHKVALLPFAEYVPLEGKLPWPSWLVRASYSYVPGEALAPFEVRGVPFGVVICWEALFPEPFRSIVAQGASFMVNLTNEAWFDGSQAGRQFLAVTVFRAVENRVSVLRAANTGISALIGPDGVVRARLSDARGQDLRVAGTLTVAIPPPGPTSFYTRHGDLFAVLCCAASVLALLLSAIALRVPLRSPSSTREHDPA